MKTIRYTACALAVAALGACSDIDEIIPQGGTLLDSQVKETNEAIPGRADATYSGMYTKLGEPFSVFGSSAGRPDDFGFIMMAFSGDVEAADVVLSDNGYNWFSVCGELTSRNADYANPYVRYAAPYNEIAAANDVIKAYPADTEDREIIYKIAQAKAIRAFSYLNLAPYFQFGYAAGAQDKPCVPIVTEETTDFTRNPRASVAKVYEQIISDLDYAVENLEGYERPDKSKIDRQVALGLRARAYLNMEKFAEAAADAAAAAEGYTPASIAEVSTPSFYNISDHNWLWGYDMTLDLVQGDAVVATSSSWLRSFSANGYSAYGQLYSCCNTLLYNKIPDTDVRKGWWVNADLESPLLDNVSWNGKSGVALAELEIEDAKTAFLPYTNVKFGMYTIGGTTNEEDWPFMRVEEMLLIQAEALYRSGDEDGGKKVLSDFVRTYRDPSYNPDASVGKTFLDELWFQRRVELWGEGFSNTDTRRLNKPLVRFHSGDATSNVPDAFKFNLTADDGWWLMRFTTSELNTNFAIVDNTGGSLPSPGQNGDLKDGVTD